MMELRLARFSVVPLEGVYFSGSSWRSSLYRLVIVSGDGAWRSWSNCFRFIVIPQHSRQYRYVSKR